MVIPASQGTAVLGSRGRIRTVDHRVKACCRNRLATRLCRCFEWMEPPLPSIPNLKNASQIFGLSTRGVLSRTSCSSDHRNLCGSIPRNNDYSLFNLADGVGFEPTDAFASAVFKTAALILSATRPLVACPGFAPGVFRCSVFRCSIHPLQHHVSGLHAQFPCAGHA